MTASASKKPIRRWWAGVGGRPARSEQAGVALTLTLTLSRAQALLDVYTIKRELGRLDNLTVALVGDLANGRTARSLAYLLSMYPGVRLVFVAPPVVAMGDDIKAFLTARGVAWAEAEDLAEVRLGLRCSFCVGQGRTDACQWDMAMSGCA